jgi:membrane protein YqaA with SNARE-associated domain
VTKADIWGWMGNIVGQYGYLGAFFISIFGNFTIFFPVPFTITIYIFGASLNPLLLGIVCGIGSTIGEFSAYIVGRGGRRVLDKRYGERLESAKLLVQRYGMLVIFLFALLPLPDDLILVPLGMLKYNLKKAMVAMFIGKTLMCTVIAYAGRFSYDFIMEIFKSGGMLGGLASVFLLVLVLIAMVRIDWTKFIDTNQRARANS